MLVTFVVTSFVVATAGARTLSPQTPPTAGFRLDAGRFTVVAEARDARLARTLLTAAQASDSFPGLPRPKAHVLIAVAPNAERFRQWVGPHAPEWGAAVAIPDEQRLVLQGSRAGSDAGDPVVVLRHELAHLALHERLGRLPPRWFDEGYASVAAGEWSRDEAFETSLTMVWRTLPSLERLEDGFFAGASEATWSYAMAYRVVSELQALDPVNGLANFFRYWKDTGSMEKAVRQAYGITSGQFEKHWQARTRSRYGALSLVTNISAVFGLFGVLLLPLYVSKRRRDRRKLEAMRAADLAQEAAARTSALQALLDAGQDAGQEVGQTMGPSGPAGVS
ncbi:peptidase MA family metallohydrolase [Gemmatimonas sp.]|uniref:peptidase MA family metallohydrolase n=1 Tax=Gemmatimonas sp. TaxID=1962908 RepID=UPI0039832E4D